MDFLQRNENLIRGETFSPKKCCYAKIKTKGRTKRGAGRCKLLKSRRVLMDEASLLSDKVRLGFYLRIFCLHILFGRWSTGCLVVVVVVVVGVWAGVAEIIKMKHTTSIMHITLLGPTSQARLRRLPQTFRWEVLYS